MARVVGDGSAARVHRGGAAHDPGDLAAEQRPDEGIPVMVVLVVDRVVEVEDVGHSRAPEVALGERGKVREGLEVDDDEPVGL